MAVESRVHMSYAFLYLSEELSTPVLNLKWHYRHDPSWNFQLNLVFALLFFFCRLGIGSFLFYSLTYTTFHVTDAEKEAYYTGWLFGVFQYVLGW